MIKNVLLFLKLMFLGVTWAFSQTPANNAICTASGIRDYPAIAANGFGNVILVWHDRRDGGKIVAWGCKN